MRMMRLTAVVLMCGLLVAGGCRREDARDEDRATPRGAVAALVGAIERQEPDGVQASFVIETEDQREYVEAMAELMAASEALRERAVERFGRLEANQLMGAAGPSGDQIARFAEGTEQIENDRARLAATTGEELELRRIEGEWRILPGNGAHLGEASAAMRQLAAALREVARAVAAGEIADVTEARDRVIRQGY